MFLMKNERAQGVRCENGWDHHVTKVFYIVLTLTYLYIHI